MKYSDILRRRAGLSRCLAWLCFFSLFLVPVEGADVPSHFQDIIVVAGLDQPVGFAFLPDGRALFVEQKTARIRLIVNSLIGSSDPLITVPQVNTAGDERGLLGIAVDPGWPARPYIYIYYSHAGTNTNYLSMYTVTGSLNNPDSDNLQITGGSLYHILTDIPDNASNHNGGTVRFGPDGMLYLSIGEDADQCSAQETASLKGVILRLDVSDLPGSGSGPPAKILITPADNPFSGPDANTRLVYCYGLRNPFRFNIDSETGDLFIADVGSSLFEEMNQAPAGGENFGWPFREGTSIRNPAGCDEPGGPGGSTYDAPIAFYDRSGFTASIMSGGLYRQVQFPSDLSFPPEYDGNCFFVEYYQGWMRRLVFENGGWKPAEPVAGQPSQENWAEGLNNPSDFLIGPDGALYYISQFGNGGGATGGALRRIAYVNPEDERPRIMTGPGPAEANPPLVRIFDGMQPGTALSEWQAYGVAAYGVNIASGNLDNDGVDEVITGPGPGAVFGPHVRAFNNTGSVIPGVSFLAYGTGKWGVNVAAGDIDKDGWDEIITGPGPGAVFGPHVRAWDVDNGTAVPVGGVNYFAYGTRKWGVNVAAADLDMDGYDEIITGAGPGAVFGPHVRGWDYDGGGSTAAIPEISFFAYGTRKWGVNIEGGRLDPDPHAEILSGAGPGFVFGPHVRGWDYDGNPVRPITGVSFFAYPGAHYGVQISSGDVDQDGMDEILTAPGPDPAREARIRGWNVDGGTVEPVGAIDFSAYSDSGLTYGGKISAGD